MKNKSFQSYDESNIKSLNLHEQLLDTLPVMILVTDKNDRICYVNKNFSNTVDYDFTADNISMKGIVNMEDWNNWNENLFKLSSLSNNDICVFNIRFNTVRATVKYVKLEGKVFKRDAHFKPLLYFFTGTDVTEQFKNENIFTGVENAAVAWKNFTVKSTAEKKLELTIKDLGRSNKELEEFAYIASHDLQEPLRKITTFSSRLAYKYDKELGDEGKLYLDKITAAACSMKELIDDLLQVSRTVAHSQPFIQTDLNSVLNEVKQQFDLEIEESNTAIIQAQLPVIDASPSQMKQLFNNLLGNAIKFSIKNDLPVIKIRSIEIDAAEKTRLKLPNTDTYYKIVVIDNGIGFKQESAEDIFRIFYRLNGKTEYQGTGIGLAICNKIVEKHNGLIWAESSPGKGASFFIVLPKTQHDNS